MKLHWKYYGCDTEILEGHYWKIIAVDGSRSNDGKAFIGISTCLPKHTNKFSGLNYSVSPEALDPADERVTLEAAKARALVELRTRVLPYIEQYLLHELQDVRRFADDLYLASLPAHDPEVQAAKFGRLMAKAYTDNIENPLEN